jgi:hypothetical protein
VPQQAVDPQDAALLDAVVVRWVAEQQRRHPEVDRFCPWMRATALATTARGPREAGTSAPCSRLEPLPVVLAAHDPLAALLADLRGAVIEVCEIPLAIRACHAGRRVASATAQQWIDRLEAARHRNALDDELERIERNSLIVVDVIGSASVARAEEHARYLRSGGRSADRFAVLSRRAVILGLAYNGRDGRRARTSCSPSGGEHGTACRLRRGKAGEAHRSGHIVVYRLDSTPHEVGLVPEAGAA